MQDLSAVARPLAAAGDLDALLERCAGKRVVLFGEASHGTHEYYRWRELASRRLIDEHGFRFVAVEGDWPDCDRVDAAVRSRSQEPPRDALDAFARWPTWMWANEEVVGFAEWLREWNAARSTAERAGFHGLDVYSLWESLRAVLEWLDEHEPDEVPTALAALRCFEPYGEDPQEYAWATRLVPERCEDQVVELLRTVGRLTSPDGSDGDGWQAFSAERNAQSAAGAERYYRAMVQGGAVSWNVRDRHMAATLDALLEHYGGPGIVWAHNTHVGDARATDMAAGGEVNLGQLARESYGQDQVALVGFAGGAGSVIAARGWGEPMERMDVPAPAPDSIEAVLGEWATQASLLLWERGSAPEVFTRTLGHRAIGVVYHPQWERRGNYVRNVMADRYDALLWFPSTEGVRPLHFEKAAAGEVETWPTGA